MEAFFTYLQGNPLHNTFRNQWQKIQQTYKAIARKIRSAAQALKTYVSFAFLFLTLSLRFSKRIRYKKVLRN